MSALACAAFYWSNWPTGLASSTTTVEAASATTAPTTPPEVIDVPSVIGLDYSVAQAELAVLGPQRLGLDVNYQLRHDLSVPAGDVLAQSVPPGAAVEPGTDLTLTVSVGPARVPGALPCQAGALRPRPGMRVSEASGQDTVDWQLTNVTSSTCVLDGYPAVSLRDVAGRVLPFVYSHRGDQMTTGTEPSPVYLPSGSAAWIRVNKYRCDIAATDYASRMVLGFRHNGGSLVVPAGFSYCAEAPSLTVTVSPFEPIELLLYPAAPAGLIARTTVVFE